MYKDYSFVVDIDGTLCPIKKKEENYEDLIPYPEMVEKLKYYKENGAKIILYTSRNMNSYHGNMGLINKYTAAVLLRWLEKWKIPYDEIIYGKAWPGHKGFYVDDRTVRPREFLTYSPEELDEICASERCQTDREKFRKNQIDIVITMGGLGSRFREAGYNMPKYMIEAKGKTLFEWSLMSLRGYESEISQYIFVVMQDRKISVENFIKEKCVQMGIANYRIVLLDTLTDGQATTVMMAEPYWNPEHALLIYNIDTYVEAGQLNSMQLRGDGFIPCFYAEGDQWSFVRLDEEGRAVEIREKERISDHCTLGAYYFKTCRLYAVLYRDYYEGNQHLVRGEKYVAPLYNALLSRGGEIYICDIPSEKVHVLGTPEDLQLFLQKSKRCKL